MTSDLPAVPPLKSSHQCRRCARWLEGEWADADAAGRIKLQRQMDCGRCDDCTRREARTELGTEDLRVLFDAVCNSLDFGSGFLDTPEVEALRRVAVILGVDPAKATPREFVGQYPHRYVAPLGQDDRCQVSRYSPRECGKPADHEIHR